MSGVACIRRWPTTTRSPWFAWWLDGRYGSSTDAVASFAWRSSGSPSSRPSRRTTKQRVPTLPTPDDLEREVDEAVALDELAPVLGQRRPVVAERLLERCGPAGDLDVGHDRRIVDDAPLAVDDRGELSRLAFIRSLPRALAKMRLRGGRAALRPSPWRRWPCDSRASGGLDVVRRRLVVPDVEEPHPGVASPSARDSHAQTRGRRSRASAAVKPLLRAAMTTLAASRLTSHSHGPGASRRSRSSRRRASVPAMRTGRSSRCARRRWPGR